MALKPTQRWLDTARAGSAEPVLLVELRPTVLYDEKNFSGDWRGGADIKGHSLKELNNISGLNTAPPEGTVEPYPDELRLARTEVVHPQQQPVSLVFPDKLVFRHFSQYENSGADTYKDVGQYVQTFRLDKALHLKKLKLGLYNYANKYKNRIRIKLYSHLNESALNDYRVTIQSKPFGSATAPAVQGIYAGAKLVHSFEYDAARDSLSASDPNRSREGRDFESVNGNLFRIFDLSAADIWLPGSNIPCALDLSVNTDDDARNLNLCGSAEDRAFERGQLLHHDHSSGKFFMLPGDMGFKFVADGYVSEGTGIWTLDLGAKPSAGLQGELELRYSEPYGTGVEFKKRESDSASSWSANWDSAYDGVPLGNKRYVQVKAILRSKDGLDSPRIYSIRAAYRTACRFVMASRPLYGYPNLVAEAPDYSAEGDPLSGRASASDTSRLVLLDAAGMLPRLFSLYNMKNDEVRVYLGFDAPGFLDRSAPEYNYGLGDWLHYKSLWIEDWEIGEGKVSLHGYDQQVRLVEAQSPTRSSSQDIVEQLHYDLLPAALIKRDFLLRARIRPSCIDFQPDPNNSGLPRPENSFGSLGAANAWRFTRAIEKPSGLHAEDQELNRHLLAFQVVDERGRWVVRRVDFAASQVLRLSGDDILEKSERFQPGHRYQKNIVAVYYGGEGSDETKYRCLSLETDELGGKSYKEYSVDKLLSGFIPLSEDPRSFTGIPRTLALSRLRLQRHGLRTVDFATRLEHAWLQIGDHVYLDSRLYRRAGAGAPNPLLVMLTRKSIDRGLGSVSWSGLVLADDQEDDPPNAAPAAPQSLSVTANGDGTVSWNWTASPDEAGGAVLRYELFRRLSPGSFWGHSVATVAARGEGFTYGLEDGPYEQLLRYDFAVCAVGLNGYSSEMATALGVTVTAAPPAPPGPEDWALESREGAIAVYLLDDVERAQSYRVHVLLGGGPLWHEEGTMTRGTRRDSAFLYFPDDPTSPMTVRVFALSSVDSHGQQGEWSVPKVQTFRRLMPATHVPGAPVWEPDSGVYPLVSWVDTGPYHGYSISLRLGAPAGEADLVGRYELQRASDSGTGGVTWSAWERLPDCQVASGETAAASLIYENRDPAFKPGHKYRYRARAIGLNAIPGLWSETLTVTLNGDTTAPDRPVLGLAGQTGQNKLSISSPTIAGGPCPDFSHWKIEGLQQEIGVWHVLEPHWGDTVFLHSEGDEGLGKSWKYRVTAYDFSGNASPVSLETGYASMQRAGTTYLSGVVNQTLAQVSVNQADISLKVSQDGVVSAINLSPENVDIAGRRITVDGDTVFSADCEIYGILKSVATADEGDRIELSTEGGWPRLKMVLNDSTQVDIRVLGDENWGLGVISVYADDVLGYGGDYGSYLCGWAWDPGPDGMLMLPDYNGSPVVGWGLAAGRGRIAWDGNAHKLKVTIDGTTYTFSPD